MLRIPIIGVSALFLGTILTALGCTAENPAPDIATRRDRVLDTGWRFLGADAPGAQESEFDDSEAAGWKPIGPPHTWNALDGQDGGDDYYRGPAWYRAPLPAVARAHGERVYLQFDGANAIADVYVNGRLLGQHRGGFSSFRFDATEALDDDGRNLLAVRVDNSPANDIAPLSADFTFFGGLYRDVHVLRVNEVHVDLPDDGSSGVRLSTSNVSADGANLSARVRVSNSGAQAHEIDVTLSVLDPEGGLVKMLTKQVTMGAGETGEVELGDHIDDPHLWQGRRDPYLYRAAVELRVDGRRTDRVDQPLGFRSLRLDPNTGFYLNGEALDLHGVNRHQDRINRGWAIGKAEHEQDLALILELGATAVRLAHYQQADYFYELCDRAGLVVWAEIPLVDAVSDSPEFSANAHQQLRELILQNYNHPSIAFWGIGNEQRTNDAPTNKLLQELAESVRDLDPDRISTYAHCCGDATGPLVQHATATGYNMYYGWYMGITSQFGEAMDALHAMRPNTPIAVSEFGAGASVNQHQDDPQQPIPGGMSHPEEYQTQLHEETWTQMQTRPYLWGKFIWNMFDFASDSRNEGDTPGRNDKGLMTYDRLTKKDAFFWYQANWTDSPPFVHITSRRFQPRTTASIEVKAYSNRGPVRLRVNGVARGEPSVQGHIFRWTGVPLAQGDNQVEAELLGAGGAVEATDSVVWTRQ